MLIKYQKFLSFKLLNSLKIWKKIFSYITSDNVYIIYFKFNISIIIYVKKYFENPLILIKNIK